MSSAVDYDHLRTLKPLRRTLWNTTLPFSSFGLFTGSGQFTFGLMFPLATPFTAVRVLFHNPATTAQTYPATCIAASASGASLIQPVQDAIGTASPWTPVTLNGAASITVPAAAIAPGSNSSPAYLLSDVIPLASFAPVDGSDLYRVYVRTSTPASGAISVPVQPSAAVLPAYNSAAQGAGPTGFVASGDGVSGTNQGNVTTANATATAYFPIAGIQFLSTSDCVTLMTSGDSLTQGALSVSGWSGFGLYAQLAASSSSCKVSLVNAGWIGQDMVGITSRTNALLAAGVVPNILTMPIDSPNDYTGNTGALVGLGQASLALSTLDKALVQNVATLLLTPFPFGTADALAGVPAQRLVAANLVRKLQARGVGLLDVAAILSGNSSSTSLFPTKPMFLGTDGEHSNDLGYGAIGAALGSLIRDLTKS